MSEVDLDLEHVFTYHPPRETQVARYERIRSVAKVFATAIVGVSPSSHERALALDKIREAVMWANAGIALNE